jgi:hypothetical protein
VCGTTGEDRDLAEVGAIDDDARGGRNLVEGVGDAAHAPSQITWGLGMGGLDLVSRSDLGGA